jgi:hypothetical protein
MQFLFDFFKHEIIGNMLINNLAAISRHETFVCLKCDYSIRYYKYLE